MLGEVRLEGWDESVLVGTGCSAKKCDFYFIKNACLTPGDPGRLNTQVRATQSPTSHQGKD